MNFEKIKIEFLIIIICLILFLPNIGVVYLFDWDEINFAESAREMIETGDWMTVRIDYEAFHEKPPLFIWMQAISMSVFGINETAARFPNVLIGIITLLVLFRLGRKLIDIKFGLIWVLAYIGSFLPHFYFRTGLIDPAFNLFIFTAIYFILSNYSKPGGIELDKQQKNILFASIFTGLAILTKGPVGLLIPLITWFSFWFINRKRMLFPLLQMIIYISLSLIPMVFWYSYILFSQGSGVFFEFISYQIRLLTTTDAGHGGPFYYHFLVLLFGCFPASVFIFGSFRKNISDSFEIFNFKVWMIILLSVILILFSIVETKIIHYSSLAYFPVTFLSAYYLYNVIYNNIKISISSGLLFIIVGSFVSVLLIGFPILMMNPDKIISSVNDTFTRELLRINVDWSLEYIPGIIYFMLLIISFIFFISRRKLEGILLAFISTSLLIFIILPILAPKINTYTQKAPIEFYKKLENRNVYLDVIGFKSYAHLFYSKKHVYNSALYNPIIPKVDRQGWLLNGNIDKDAYFVAKINNKWEYLDRYPQLIYLYEKNGFVFFYRKSKYIPEFK